MEPDYFIHQYLQIEHTRGVSYIELKCIEKKYCQFILNTIEEYDNNDYDSDFDNENNKDDSYSTVKFKIQRLQNKMKYLFLIPRPPILIYQNKQFVNKHFMEKYKKIIENKINEKEPPHIFIEYRDTGKLEFFDSIIRITKVECRYDPWLDND
jgi:hypothetical protein